MHRFMILVILLSGIGIALVANLVILDLKVFTVPGGTNTIIKQLPPAPSPAASPLAVVATPTPNPSSQQRTPKPVIIIQQHPTDSFIPLVGGSTTSSDWEDVPGSEAYIDSHAYGTIKAVYFEVTMHIPTKNGVMSARLFDVTGKHPVWNSDVSVTSDTPTRVTSFPFSLDTGYNLYRVQVKTSLQYQSILDLARIRISSG